MVMLFHVETALNYHAHWPPLPMAIVGVDIFFVISGFIMWQSTASGRLGPFEFLRKRVTRIAPLYWLVTLVMCAIPLISGTLAGGLVPDLKHTLASLAFIPWHADRDPAGVFFPVYIPGWTLNFEMFFYVVFAACLWIGDLRWRLSIAIGTFCVLVLIGLSAPPKSAAAWSLSPIILEFAAGLALGAWASTQRRLPALVAGLMVIGGILVLVAVPAPPESHELLKGHPIHWGIAAIVIVLGVVELERHQLIPKSPVLLTLGDASYALYLTHIFIISAAALIWERLHLWTSVSASWTFLVVVMGLCLLTALITHFRVELPLIARARKFLEPAKSTSPAPL
jgi:exopolysaccharide production protein ExoZ